MARLQDPLRAILGGRTAKPLEEAFGIRTVGDLLRHYPRRYSRRGELTDLASLADGEQATVMGRVAAVSSRPMRGRRGTLLEAEITDGVGRLTLTFFNQAWRQRDLSPGRTGLFAGKVGTYRNMRQLAHPDYVLLPEGELTGDTAAEFLRDFIPVYPATGSLHSWTIAECVRLALDQLDIAEADDPVPADVRRTRALAGLAEALRLIHAPQRTADIERARDRLRFDEAWIVQTVLAQRRHAVSGMAAKPRPAVPGGLVDALHERLPFALTGSQRGVLAELDDDLASPHPMHRLLQGEVGSGKTVVALHAMLRAVESGGQAALLAPTEVLAEQHLRSLRSLLGPLAEGGMLGGSAEGTRVDLLTGSSSAGQRRRALTGAAGGETGILVGTHALLSDPVQFAELALVVVDEQHRFGVEQRAALVSKAQTDQRPHLLVMTATPIPRTIAMTVFGDLSVSTLRELPAGRTPIRTHVVPDDRPAYVSRMWERIAEEVGQGRQAYIVCPRIDAADAQEGQTESEQIASVVELATWLAAGPLAAARIGVLHGRLTSAEKEAAMRRFADPGVDDGLDVLVATTVIEVGVDVPNATVMVVMHAERFGVSQLHQLRGRVGRGSHSGLCLLHTSAADGSAARQRVEAVSQTLDGFALAEVDLRQRREGDVLGAVQSGRSSSLELLSVLRDEDVISAARTCAEGLIGGDPLLERYPALAAAVAHWRLEDRLDYVDKA